MSVYAGSNTTASNVGTITIVRFANPSGLTSEGRNLLAETTASGAPITGTPGLQELMLACFTPAIS